MSVERDDSVRAAADAVSAGKATKETVDALLGRPHPTADSAIERGPATPEDRFAELARLTSAYMDAPEEAMLRRAFEFARAAHAGQCRKSGEPFIIHPIEVGIILADLRMDAETITAALLHDTVEDTKVTAEEVERTFNPQVRALVEGVTKITRIEVESLTDEQAATIRKMFVAMSKDIRVIVIKLADRLHNMRTLAALREDRRIFKSRETLEIYAPIAHRLGINSIKWELDEPLLLLPGAQQVQAGLPHGDRVPRRAREVPGRRHRRAPRGDGEGGDFGPDHGASEASVLHLPEDDEEG